MQCNYLRNQVYFLKKLTCSKKSLILNENTANKFYNEVIIVKDIEEKIKKFFSNEENIKKLMSNEEFMNKISDGVVDAKTYQLEFKKLGLDLTDEEAAQTVEITNKLVTTPPEKLKEISLENITGGNPNDNNNNLSAAGSLSTENKAATMASAFVWGTVIVEGLATAIAAIACHVKSKKYEKNGNIEGAFKYKNISSLLTGLSTASLGIPILNLMAAVPIACSEYKSNNH